jgi:hypothetical protein
MLKAALTLWSPHHQQLEKLALPARLGHARRVHLQERPGTSGRRAPDVAQGVTLFRGLERPWFMRPMSLTGPTLAKA